jgi:hypothetical protein
MARKKSAKSKEETRTSFIFPSLHRKVMNAVSDEVASTLFEAQDSDTDSNNKHSTHVMGKFKCSNNVCSAGD